MKNRLFKNLGWKLGGLLLALVLWFHLTTQQEYSKSLTVDIEYTDIPFNLTLAPGSQKMAQIQLTTDGKTLFKILYFDHPKIVINLVDFTHPGEYSMAFSEDQLVIPSGPSGVTVKFIAPLACDFGLLAKPAKQN